MVTGLEIRRREVVLDGFERGLTELGDDDLLASGEGGEGEHVERWSVLPDCSRAHQ